MKKLAALLLAMATIGTALPITLAANAESPAVSEASASSAVSISSEADLAALAGNLTANAVLTQDITISNADWKPIGTVAAPFTGTLDGAGHTITYQINKNTPGATKAEVGLFGSLAGEVKNLTVAGSLTVSISNGYVGTIAATLQEGGMIYNCNSSVTLTATSKTNMACGGLAGAVIHNASQSDVDGTIRLSNHSGKMDLTVTANTANEGIDLTDGNNGTCGGILGLVGTTAYAEVNKCINTGEITVTGGKYDVAGIVGMTSVNSYTVADITECANKGNITIYNLAGERAAGIIAYARCSIINYCYNTGEIIAYSDKGNTVSREGYGTYFGIFGYANLSADNTLSVQYCYSFTKNPLEAEICLVRNPSFATFKNFYQQGREEYETAISSNAAAGTPGTAFKDVADLTAKITAATDKYKANPNGGAPILAFETSNTLSAGSGAAGYLNYRQSGTGHDLRVLLSTKGDITEADVKLTFTGSVSGVETSIGKSDSKFKEASVIHAADVAYTPVEGGKIYSLVISGLAEESWTKLTLTVTNGGNTIMNGSVNYADVFGEKAAAAIPFASLPDYPDGTVSPVYNAGPGKESDQKGTTGTDSQMVVISKTTAASYESYLSKLEAAGYKKESDNKIEDNLFCTMTKGSDLIYLYYTAKTKETRIIWDRSSTTTPTKVSSAKTGSGTTEFYQYALDFTKATGQTWGGDYWQIDCGMNYIIKLPDNSVFIVDGGHERHTSKAALEAYDEFLHQITGTPAGKKVTIAGWFFTHAHGDHVYFSYAFLEKYHANYDLKCVYYNFPSYSIGGSYDSGTFLMKDTVNKYYPKADHVKLHTGQELQLQGVGIEVLFTHEDAVNSAGRSTITDFNETSTVIRFNIGGKTFIMLGDAATVAENILCNMYTKATLKSDAVQIAHHNYNNLPKLYPAIAANLLLVPNSKENSEASHNQVKIDVAIKAATNPVILYEGDYTYKITVENGQIKYAQMDRYTVGMEFTFPADLVYPDNGPKTAEKPVSDSVLAGLANLNDQIIDKSGFGTVGANGAEAPQCILDGNTATKWCVTSGTTAYVAWKMKIPVTLSAYQLFAGNDTEKFPQRNPKSWVLYGSKDGKTWEVIDAVYDGGMSTTNFSASTYKVDSPVQYQYFALKIFAYTSGTTMQISDIALYGKK